jgi:hypothetical protein
MDPLRSDLRPAEALSGPERDARIEQLLLAGLDEYFAHRYEHAINLWTRVLFLDRQHDRARAYIDRARRAQAERQRESEAALHQAIDALRAGDVDRARALVTLALDRGASPDDAQGMLERIERLGVSRIGVESRCRPAASAFRWSSVGPAARDEARPRTSASASTALLLSLAACGVLGVAMWGRRNRCLWRTLLNGCSRAPGNSPPLAACTMRSRCSIASRSATRCGAKRTV